MERSVYPPVKRIIAIGDLHGDYDALIAVLKKCKLINNDLKWVGSKTYLVQIGDQVDSLCRDNSNNLKNPQELKIMLYLNELGEDARKSGGRVISLLGNHEMMNMQGDFRYASDVDIKVMNGINGRKELFKPGGQLARVLSKSRLAVVKIGDYIFVHAGIIPKVAKKYSLEKINEIARRFMSGEKSLEYTPAFQDIFEGPNGILWTRKFSKDHPNPDLINKSNSLLSSKAQVVGHTVQDKGINSVGGGGIWRIDTGMSKAFGKRRKIQALEIINNGAKIRVLK
jgi:hypothetical protein